MTCKSAEVSHLETDELKLLKNTNECINEDLNHKKIKANDAVLLYVMLQM